MNIACSTTRVYSTNFYHFLAQQLQAIYFYKIENSLDFVNLYYDGPFAKIIQHIDFIKLHDLKDAPKNTEYLEPYKDHKMIKTYAHYLKFLLLPKINQNRKRTITIAQREKNRNIKNIKELKSKLEELADVEVIDLDKLDFLEQFEKLYNSKIVIMPHGAAMAFCLLLSSNTSILELYPKYFNELSYYSPLTRTFSIPHVEIENESSLYSCSTEDKFFINGYISKNNRISKHDIHNNHKLRSLLRDTQYIFANISNIENNVKQILNKS